MVNNKTKKKKKILYALICLSIKDNSAKLYRNEVQNLAETSNYDVHKTVNTKLIDMTKQIRKSFFVICKPACFLGCKCYS